MQVTQIGDEFIVFSNVYFNPLTNGFHPPH
ncbi:MAG: hypothetical protein ACI9HA_003735 [Dinoroseobacter sp.]